MSNKHGSLYSIDDKWAVSDRSDSQPEQPLKKPSVKAMKPVNRRGSTDSSISWIWETVGDETENDYDEDEDEDSISYSPLTKTTASRRASNDWDMSIINSAGSDDEGIFFDPSARSIQSSGRMEAMMTQKMNKSNSSIISTASSRVDVKEKISRSSSSLTSWEWKEVSAEDEREILENSRVGLDNHTGVKFGTVHHTYEYPTRNDYSEEEFSKCFYSSLESSIRLESRSKLIDKINNGKTKNPDTARGLEYWVQNTSVEIDRRIDSMIAKVMDEQDLQIERRAPNPMKLAEMSLSVSMESAAVALKIAQRDAKLARKAYREMFEKEQELDVLTFPSNASTATTATMSRSSLVLPDSLVTTKRGKEEDKIEDENGSQCGSSRSLGSRRSSKSLDKPKKEKEEKDETETKDRRKMMKKRRSSKKMGKKQKSQRSVGSTSKKSKKSKKKGKSKNKEGSTEFGSDLENEEKDRGKSPDSATKKKRKSLDSGKKKRRSSGSEIKAKKEKKQSDDGKVKGKRRSSTSDVKVKEKRRSSATEISSANMRRDSTAATVLKHQKRRSSTKKQEQEKLEEVLLDPKKYPSSLSSTEDEFLSQTKYQSKESTKDQSKDNSQRRRSFLSTQAYKEIGSSWLKFLRDRGEDPAFVP